jgi:GH15 family glucan-1,4-alpha-glucosidase
MVLETHWELPEGALVLADAMLWPQNDRAPEQAAARVLVRRLRGVRGKVWCDFDLKPACNFEPPAGPFTAGTSGFSLPPGELSAHVWSNQPLEPAGAALGRRFELAEGEEVWAVLELGGTSRGWTVELARQALEETTRYWRDWVGRLSYKGYGEGEIRRSAMMVHLLTYAPNGAVMAAATTSLPERIGGGWNADYRLCWLRDASLSVAMLSRLGNQHETEQYLQWLDQRRSRLGRPLGVLYGLRGEKRPHQHQVRAAAGYRGSQPVRVGNHAYKQHQLGSLGFLADCAWIYLTAGGRWREEYWQLLRSAANYTVKHWEEAENGIWELPVAKHYVSSKVLSWVMLDRAVRIAQQVTPSFDTTPWRAEADTIRQQVLEKGWSERLGAFRQDYDSDSLDAAGLLISVLEFLPGDDPRVLATVDRIAQALTIDGWVYRFDPLQTTGLGEGPMGQFEGAFLPCTFWLATAYVKAGRLDQAKALLERVEKIAGPVGLLAEAVDPRTCGFLGNTPLLFSHVEYVRAKWDLARALG